MNVYQAVTLSAVLISFGIGVFVLLKNIKNSLNFVFFVFSLCISSWCFSHFITMTKQNVATSIFYEKLFFAPVSFMPAFWLLVVYNIAGKKIENDRIGLYLARSSFILSPLCFLLTLSPFFFREITPSNLPFIKTHLVPGVSYYFFLFYWYSYATYGFCKAYSFYKKSIAHKNDQLKYFLLATFIGFLGSAIYFLSVFGIKISFPHDVLTIIYLLLMAYAIVKYRLMDIRVVVTRTAIFVAVYTIVLGLPFLLINAGKDWLIIFLGTNWWLGPLILMAILATTGPFAYIYLLRNAEAILLREQRSYQETLKQAAIGIARIRNSKKLLDFIAYTITKTVRISHSAIYLFDPEFNQFILKAGRNLNEKQPISIDKKNPLIHYLEKQNEPLVYEEVKRKSEDNPDSVFTQLESEMALLNAKVVVASFLEEKLLNILILGDKLSKRPYTSEDLHNFSVFVTEAALAIDNALRYENIEEQVRQRTKELMEVQNQLVQAEKLATVGTLAGGVAHEINNPLTAILTNVQMLLAAKPIDSELDRESLELIEEATKRCRTIVQKLMTYAKKPLESARLDKVDLRKVLDITIAFISYQLEQENIKINTQIDEGGYFVSGNHNELEQVVTNLILNAKDAIKRLKKSGIIHVAISKKDETIMIEVQDEGPGIPQGILSKIFDPFFTTKDVGKGLGLGLSICHSIIAKHKGTISVESEPNQGAVFTVQLPAMKEESKVKS